MRPFYNILANSLVASSANAFVWFAVTFWVYLETRSVIATSIMAGVYTLTVALSGFFLGSLVDRYKKKTVMLFSSVGSLALFALAFVVFLITPTEEFSNPSSINLWVFVVLSLFGAIAGNLRGIALLTVVTIMVPEDRRDRANGLVGTINGVSFLAASIFGGLVIGYLGIFWMLVSAILVTVLVIAHLLTISIPEHPQNQSAETQTRANSVDIRGTIRAIQLVPGLFGLIFFQTFNNFLGGVYLALLDAYGLSLTSVQVWGVLFGLLSLGFIVGGLVVARKGLGKNPLRTLFLCNIVMWSICSVFTLQASAMLLGVGMFVWLCIVPAVEAAEQTIMQKVVSPERQGRVFGFAQSIEQAAAPITAFLIGPIAELVFIPFMTTGAGVELLGPWFGTGTNRGLALLFTVAGVIGLVVTLLAMRSRLYTDLSETYLKEELAHPTPRDSRAPLPGTQ